MAAGWMDGKGGKERTEDEAINMSGCDTEFCLLFIPLFYFFFITIS